SEAGDLIAASEGDDAAARYLGEAVEAMGEAGFMRETGVLSTPGLRYAGARRDSTWIVLTMRDLVREEVEDPNYLGIPVDSPRRRELNQITRNIDLRDLAAKMPGMQFESRDEVLARAPRDGFAMPSGGGEYKRAVPLWQDGAVQSEREGQIAMSVQCWAQTARCLNALGDLAAARDAYQKGRAAGARLTSVSPQLLQLVTARGEMCLALDEHWEKEAAAHESFVQKQDQSFAVTWFQAAFRAGAAQIYAHLGKSQPAIDELNLVIVPLERAPGGAPNYPRMACNAAATLWMLARTDHVEAIERNIRNKVVAPDFRYPMVDARLSLARLCALQGRYDEAAEWFVKSRTVLDEQGARPLRAIADFDEAWMYLRRAAQGDKERARPLLDAAIAQFKSIGMTGWLRRADNLFREPAAS